jgi:hypothetical protein
VRASDTQIEVSARCESCEWVCEARNALVAGSEHARKHRHSVVVTEHRLIFFNGNPPKRDTDAAPRLPL